MKCPRCGSNNNPAANFCSRCGLQLAVKQPAKVAGQRRPVAVIFADISGFTTMAEKLDPEEVKDLVDECLQRLAGVIQGYEGFVDKFIGDCVMALFGAPVTHEDDPLRAVLSALDLLGEIEKFNLEKKQNLSLSIGINYGTVATGDLGRAGAYTVMGDTVNLAQRLQRAAPRGSIYVSESIQGSTENEIEYRKLKPIAVKGRQEKVMVFIPLRARLKHSLRKIKEMPMIGRTAELNKLQKIFSGVQAARGHIVAISGEAGIGKTKLIYEFKKLLPKEQCLVEGKGIEYRKTSPYLILKEQLKTLFNIIEGDSPEEAGKKIDGHLKKMSDMVLMVRAPYFKYFLASGLSRTDNNRFESMRPEDRVRLVNEAIFSLFFKIARTKSLVIIFDDCHWIDAESINFMHKLSESAASKKIMVITLFRPEFNMDKTATLPNCTAINLKPLPPDDTVEFLKRILTCKSVEPNLVKLLVEKSGAIPFYIHELTASLHNNSLIFIENGTARLKPGSELTLPRSLDELVMTKVDKMDADLRMIVNIASVIGDEFSSRLLAELLPRKREFSKELATIEHLEIIQPAEQEKRGEELRYCFKHSIIRDAVYNSLLKKERKEFHRAIGFGLEKIYAGNLDEYYDALANHFFQGGEEDKAVQYLEKAGDRKKELYLNDDAIKIYQKCISLMGKGGPGKIARIQEKLGQVYDLIGRYDEAIRSYKEMETLANDEPIIKARACTNTANVLKNQGNFDRALAKLDSARETLRQIKIATGAEVMMELSNVLSLECWIYRVKGKMEDAEKKGREAIAMIMKVKEWKDHNGLKRTLAKGNNNLAIVYCVKGEFEKAVELCEETIMITEELGDQRGKGNIYNVLGTIYKGQGNYDLAIESFTKNLKISEELGNKNGMGVAYCNLGNVYQNKGEFMTAIDLYEAFLRISEELGDKVGIGTASNNIGIVYFNKGEYAKAVHSFEKYLRMSQELGDKRGTAIAYGNLGEIYANQFEYKKAAELFRKYLKMSEELGDKRGIGSASYNLGVVAVETDDLKNAIKYLNSALNIFTVIGNKIAIGNVFNGFAHLRLKEGKPGLALEMARSALQIGEETNFRELKAMSYLNLGRVQAYENTDINKAEESFTQAVTLAQGLKNTKLLADIYREYADFLKATKKTKEAVKAAKQAQALYRELKLVKRTGKST